MLMGEIHRKECLSPDGDSNTANPSVICCRMLRQEELELKNSRGCVMSSKPAWAIQPCLKRGGGGGRGEMVQWLEILSPHHEIHVPK